MRILSLSFLVILCLTIGCRPEENPAAPDPAGETGTDGTTEWPGSSWITPGRNLQRPDVWAGCERFESVVTPATFKPGRGRFDELYMNESGFELGVPLISDAKPGDRNYNGGRWHLNVIKDGVPDGKYAHACAVGDLDLADFESTAEYFECPLLPRRGHGKRPKALRVPADYPTIQDALDGAIEGDEVVVSPGTYFDPVVVPALTVVIRSESNDPDDTILDGSRLGDGDVLVYFAGDPPGTRVLRGFTLRAASGSAVSIDFQAESGHHVIENCRFVKNGPLSPLRSGGLSVDILKNEFIGNSAYLFGGAVLLEGNGRIVGNVFRDNAAIPFGGLHLTQGGAIYLASLGGREGSTVEIRGNVFEGNRCTDYGGAIHIPTHYSAVVEGNLFVGNEADECAGAVYVVGQQAFGVTIERNLFVGDRSPRGAAIGIDVARNVSVRFNTIVDARGGEAVRIESSGDVELEGNIVAFCEERGIRWSLAFGTQVCNDSYGNPLGNYIGGPVSPTNFSVDPLLCDRSALNLYLSPGSPCLPENNDCTILIGALPEGCEGAPVETSAFGRLGNGE